MPAHDDHTSQLFADAYSDLIERAPVAPTLEEITTLSVNSSTGGKPPPKTSQIWVVIAAAAAVVLVIGLIPLLVDNADPQPADTIVQPTTLGELVLTPGTWSRVPHDETNLGGPGKQSMSDVTVGGPGLVAVGASESEESESEAAVWTSADGITWSRVPHDEEVFGGPDEQYMNSVTAGGPGLVAVGVSESEAAVWTSVDGITWSRVPHDETNLGGPGRQWMSDVTVGGPGLVAVGVSASAACCRMPEDPGSGASESEAAVWTSVDGFTWSRVPHDESVFGGPDNQGMQSVTTGGPGLVAVGREAIGDWVESPVDAAVWTSVDGLTWSRVPHDESVFGEGRVAVMFDVTVGGPGLVAVGVDSVGSGVWTSVDGLTWSRIPHDEVELRHLQSVTAGGPGLVAVGNGVWVSANGTVWSQVPDDNGKFGDVGGNSVTAGGPGLVAVGTDFSDDDAAVWVSLADD